MTRVRCADAAAITFLPVSGPPVKNARSTPCASSSWLSVASPSNTAIASGSRNIGSSRASSAEVAGACSDGLTTTTFPAASAPIIGASVRETG